MPEVGQVSRLQSTCCREGVAEREWQRGSGRVWRCIACPAYVERVP